MITFIRSYISWRKNVKAKQALEASIASKRAKIHALFGQNPEPTDAEVEAILNGK